MVRGRDLPILGGIQAELEPPADCWPLVAELTTLEAITSLDDISSLIIPHPVQIPSGSVCLLTIEFESFSAPGASVWDGWWAMRSPRVAKPYLGDFQGQS